MKKKENKLYEVEIKSMSILRDGKKSFITYFQGGPAKRIISNLKILYPQYMNTDDKPMVNITPISMKEYLARKNGEQIEQKGHMMEAEGNIVK
jgi:hypothetical protein